MWDVFHQRRLENPTYTQHRTASVLKGNKLFIYSCSRCSFTLMGGWWKWKDFKNRNECLVMEWCWERAWPKTFKIVNKGSRFWSPSRLNLSEPWLSEPRNKYYLAASLCKLKIPLLKGKKKKKTQQNYWTETCKHNGNPSKFSEGDSKYMIISHSREHIISCSPRYILTFSWLQLRQQNAFGTVSLDVYHNRCLLQVLSASQIKSRASIHNTGMKKNNHVSLTRP